ncbi:ribosomal P protein AGP2beta-1 [Trypanosoma rangeli]|uniref:Ribosomal P protein AGP2beta-1 n=1 Tax=Trypanosoma rangeli TaxID=5698 RepID=A0A422NA66_TRYRA|nr:ribosomal P protein AGP2beta-1 [Trypanosoma rangeli]RNF02367.1 ribosomal P protein AGP2beta-1 [Trypanosoma rangeli]|eukprot:RNF02367.1 ribosomal P protein AGP2beta-1 [Trypanosoma rangeli]
MALQTRRDSYNTSQQTLSSLVALCTDCPKFCHERTERVVENSSRAPRGWESQFMAVAEQRRSEERALCERYCHRVASVCPAPTDIERFEALGYKEVTQRSALEGLPTVQQMSRCENAASEFSRVLFSLAHKPSKVSFDNVDPKTGAKVTEEGEGEATEVHKKVLSGGSIDDAILKRWSTARRGRADMEELGVIRSAEETARLKHERDRELVVESSNARGTTPRW